MAREEGRIDVLVNNAGVSSTALSPSQVEVESLRAVFEVNVFGVLRVTNAFLALLRAGTRPRLVNVSSSRGALSTLAHPPSSGAGANSTYQSSKAALNALTLLYAHELAADGIRVNAVDPGPRATDLLRAHGTAPPGAGNVDEGARAIVGVALDESETTGQFFDPHGDRRSW